MTNTNLAEKLNQTLKLRNDIVTTISSAGFKAASESTSDTFNAVLELPASMKVRSPGSLKLEDIAKSAGFVYVGMGEADNVYRFRLSHDLQEWQKCRLAIDREVHDGSTKAILNGENHFNVKLNKKFEIESFGYLTQLGFEVASENENIVCCF